ncbi:hypothetical protein TGME49_234165 [Toxoplasma gondii ME49]|uniref:Uncharacterized protein n=1 Tax=Toxoplasma gondii (strain ATCC 50611 / Me49) TaxID=508771 RepID=S8EWV8_TOXGM|nr:hypothetical protein TGME49_234165 [Toxoplasma gondii ME49]EPT26812.1 hypothetical protein TGME49_234165 [Toxoplasma gondii ME49]|eukprot:XP_002368857.2 hypothetical protein TGME49_234165 [Toxoplasma gondii ME49]
MVSKIFAPSRLLRTEEPSKLQEYKPRLQYTEDPTRLRDNTDKAQHTIPQRILAIQESEEDLTHPHHAHSDDDTDTSPESTHRLAIVDAASELRRGMEARADVVAMARDIGAWTSADPESGDSAAAFVDTVLVPAGVVSEVASMMERAREAMNVDGLVAPDTADFDEYHLKALLGLAMELENIVSSKIACVAMAKAFFKFVLVPLKLAAPVARLLLDQKPKLLLAFASKALLLRTTGGNGFGDDNMKKLLLLALVAPKALDLLKLNTGGDLLPLLKLLPLLGGTKLEALLPIALLAMTAFEGAEAAGFLKALLSQKLSSGRINVESTSEGVSGDEMAIVDYVVESWTTVEEESAAGVDAASELRRGMEARADVVAMARDIGAWTSADPESGDSAAAFVDTVLVPAGVVSEVASMMERAREAMNVDGLVAPDTADFDEYHLKALLGLAMELENIVSSKIACVAMAKAFFKFVLVPLKLAAPVARLLLDQKPKLLLAFASKALLLRTTGGNGFGDDNMKKLLLLALVAPKALDLLKLNTGGDLLPLLKLLPLLGGTKLEALLPIALLAMTAFEGAEAAGFLKALLSQKLSSGRINVESTSEGVSGDEMAIVDYVVESWTTVEEESAAGVDAASELRRGMEARADVVAMARDIGAWTSADPESGDSAAAFVDTVLVPAGVVSEVASMMERAREAMNVDGLVAPDTADFDEYHLKALLGLAMELENIVSSKIACVAMAKAFFKFVLVPLKLAAPVARLLLDQKPKLLLAFASKALLLRTTGGNGFGDDNMKKLLLLALVAPKALDLLKLNTGGDLLPLLKLLPLLGGTKLEALLPIALLAMTAFEGAEAAGFLKALLSQKLSSGRINVESTSEGVSGDEMAIVDYVVESWTTVEEESAAGVDAASELRRGMEARADVVAMARDIGAWTSADPESGDSAAAFVDTVLVPAGVVSEVASMMERAREAMNVDGLVAPDTADFDEYHLKALLGLAMELENIVSSKIACVAMAKAFFKFVLVPLKLAAPVARLLLDQKPKLLLAFASKALLLRTTGGNGFGDVNMKKLLLLALVAPKALDLLKLNTGGDLLPLLKLLPLLGGTKLEALLPIALLAMTGFDAF